VKNKINPEFANADKPSAAIFFSNDIAIGEDGWAMITRFGDYPSTALFPDGKGGVKKEKAIQRVDKAGAEQMVASFANSRRGVRKLFKGCNIYDGHPDAPGIGKFYPDKEPKGVFANLEVREDGLYGQPIFTNDGFELVEKKLRRAFSGRIGEAEPCGEDSNGVPIFRPTELFSAGLTNNPHLPVHFFNSDGSLADASTHNDKNMKKTILKMCTALGIQFANDADDAQTEAALDKVEAKVVAFANEQTANAAKTKTLKEKLLGLCAKVGISFANADAITDPTATLAQVEDKIVTLSSDRDSLKTQFANERKERVESELGYAVQDGRITEAERAQWKNRLSVEAQFANELTSLRALEGKVKTEAATRSRLDSNVDLADPVSRRQFCNDAVVNICKEKNWDVKKDYDRAFRVAQERHPEAFGMKKKK
jgi:hypothetical protein